METEDSEAPRVAVHRLAREVPGPREGETADIQKLISGRATIPGAA
jgi:hypothetical protein